MYYIEYQLLSFPSTLPKPPAENTIDKACRLGALLYMKAILEEYPHSTTGPSILAEQLRGSLLKMQDIDEGRLPLLIWLGMVGAVVARTAEESGWFVAFLAALKGKLRIEEGEDAGMEMCRVLGMRKVFGRRVDGILDEIMVTRLSHKSML